MENAGKEIQQGSHLSDATLLCLLDGEPPPNRAASARNHIEACWSCRTRKNQIEATICALVGYRDHLSNSHLPRPAGRRSLFVAQLEHLIKEGARPTFWARSRLTASRCLGVPRLAWVVPLVIVAFGLTTYFMFSATPTVSANELLQKAAEAEVLAVHGVDRPVIYQKLRIRQGSYSVTRTRYHDVGGNRQADSSNIGHEGNEKLRGVHESSTTEAELKRTFQTAGLNWDTPLSAAAYCAWHSTLRGSRDNVYVSGKDYFTLITSMDEGPIEKSRLTVRQSDYHPVHEQIHLRGFNTDIELTELAFSVLNFEVVDPTIFLPAQTDNAAELRLALPRTFRTVPSGPTEAELANIELQALLALHGIGADSGEQIEVKPTPWAVEIRGVASTDERKEQVLSATRGIPYLKVRIKTVNEAAPKADSELGVTDIPGEPLAPRLERLLLERFPNPDEREAFVNRSLALAQEATVHVWALRRLRDSYPPQRTGLLNSTARSALLVLLQDHGSAVRELMKAEKNTIFTIMTDDDNKLLNAPRSVETVSITSDPRDWRASVTQVFPLVATTLEDIAALFAGSKDLSSPDSEVLARELQSTLLRLDAELSSLDDNIYRFGVSENTSVRQPAKP